MLVEKQKKLIYELFEHEKALLIILDACRYDIFKQNIEVLNPLKVEVKKVVSSGSCTSEWFKNTFDKPLDVIYISSNPMIVKAVNKYGRAGYFKKIVDVSSKFWDSRLFTVKPYHVNFMASLFISFNEKLIIHYSQPHAPFLNFNSFWLRGKPGHIYKRARINPIARYYFKKAYVENLRQVLEYVKRLVLKAINKGYKRIVISADHGELLGMERSLAEIRRETKKTSRYVLKYILYILGIYRMVGHPCGSTLEELIIVPWAEIRT